MNSIRTVAALALVSLGCATAGRPPLAATWCANEDDRECGEKYAAMYAHADLYSRDDGNWTGMHNWFAYRCAFDPNSQEAAAGANEPGLDCFRAGQIALAQGNVVLAREHQTRGCEEFGHSDACTAAAELAHEKLDLVLAHELDCRGKRSAEERNEPMKRYEFLDCEPGSESKQRLKVAEMAKLGRPAPPVTLVECALHGCDLADGRQIRAWVTAW